MAEALNHGLTWRKLPKQARSASLVADILQAAAQVLAKEGARRFTTARVAEAAGVSVGSLYQYFPNKAAILFRLQADEWRDTGELLRGLLEDRSDTPSGRLRRTVEAFVRSECAEAQLRIALGDAAPLYRDAPEAQEPRAEGTRSVALFMEEALPALPEETRRRVADVIMMTLGSVGKRISETVDTPDEIAAYADALADMLCGYLDALAR